MIAIGLVGCEGKLAREILALVNKLDDFYVKCAVTFPQSPKIGMELSTFTKYNKNSVIVTEELLSCNNCDVLIDATNRDAFIEMNYKKYMKVKKPLLIATTGFSGDDMVKIRELADNIAIVKEANYSIELFFFIRAVKEYARHSRSIDATIIEEHHKEKRDIPSGTALTILEEIKKENKELNINIVSVRAGAIHGEHRVLFANNSGEEITFIHKVTSREVFADGIIKSILPLLKKGKGLYGFADIL